MKKWMALPVPLLSCVLLCGCTVEYSGFNFLTVLLILLGLAVTAFGGLRAYNIIQYNKRRRRRKLAEDVYTATAVILVAGLILLVLSVLTLFTYGSGASKPEETQPAQTQDQPDAQTTEPPQTEPPILFAPHKVSASDPANWGISWEIFQENTAVSAYSREAAIAFEDPEAYFALPGISAFRGNNYRNSATYGTTTVTAEELAEVWSYNTTTLEGSNWSGSGWTGQPLIVQWDTATKKIMNLYPQKQAKEGLVEVIYATLDGHIYFLDLEDGSATRDPVNIGLCFKGAGSLDPRGWPLMYVGAGDANASGERPRMYIISLIDGSVLFEYGHQESLSLRTDNDNWCAFDSSPLVHGETDTLIWPGESGILYTMKLNTSYDKAAGTIQIAPDNMVKTRYNTGRSSSESYWLGYEASVNIVENYLYVSENGGMFYCIDLNTMELVWAQDTKDDSNSTPVFERTAEDAGYVYTAPSLHWTQSADATGTISIYKLDAITGEIVWQKPYDVHTISGVSGGVQSTPLLGKPGTSLEGKIIYTISRIPDEYTGIMVALDTKTGAEVWRMDMTNYAWSSPVAVYDEDGTGYVVICDSMGYAMLVDGSNGNLLYTIALGGLIEASPAVYENMLVVGTRKEKICGVKIS